MSNKKDDKNAKKIKIYKKSKRRTLFVVVGYVLLVLFISTYVMTFTIGFWHTNQTGYPTIVLIPGKDGELEENKDFNIFSNPNYNDEKIIYPGLEGEYYFRIENQNSTKLEYNITFKDINLHKIPMRYRLRINNVYIVGSDEGWVDINGMNVTSLVLEAHSVVLFKLEWFWPEDEEYNDPNGVAVYTLSMTIKAAVHT